MTRRDVLTSIFLSSVAILAGCDFVASSEFGTVSLNSPSGRVVVSLVGGRIVSWKDAKGHELFFMPAKPDSMDGDWSHGGTSICWPWFGRKGNVQSLIHGFARNSVFTLRDKKAVPGGVSLTLGLKVAKTDNENFPYDAEVLLTVTLTDKLSMKMTTVNLGNEPFEVTEGIQSYFPVADYAKIVFYGIEKDDFAAVHGMDKAFIRHSGCFGYRDAASGREIRMEAKGNSGLVVWTPGTVEPANRNLASDDCPKFIVLGPSSRKAEGVVSIKPGESHTLEYSIFVSEASKTH